MAFCVAGFGNDDFEDVVVREGEEPAVRERRVMGLGRLPEEVREDSEIVATFLVEIGPDPYGGTLPSDVQLAIERLAEVDDAVCGKLVSALP